MWISVDWGNSAFRMRVANGDTVRPRHTWRSSDGAWPVYRGWLAGEGAAPAGSQGPFERERGERSGARSSRRHREHIHGAPRSRVVLPEGLSQADAMRQALSKLVRRGLDEMELDPGPIPVVVSGMASSTIGIESLPYAECPFVLDGGDLVTRDYPADEVCGFHVLTVSGLCSTTSTMRGE